MIEPIMYMAIGFLVSTLLGLMLLPLVHNRAVRLTTRRLEASAPVSMAEVQADKDQLRAEFAVAARKLELTIDQLKSRSASQLAELGKKTDAVNRLKVELSERSAEAFALKTREQAFQDQLRTTTEQLQTTAGSLQQTQQALAEQQAEVSRLTAALADRAQIIAAREAELAALVAQVEALKQRVDDVEQQFVTTQQQLEQERSDHATTRRERDEAQERLGGLDQRMNDLDGRLTAQLQHTESLSRRADDFQQQLAAREEQLAQREADNARLRAAREEAETAVKQLRDEIFALSHGMESPRLAALETDSRRHAEELQAARDEAVALKRELSDNALLREQISQIAAEIASVTLALEGPESPINAILAADAEHGRRPARAGTSNGAGKAPQDTLAERIRALQSRTTQQPRRSG